jgi:hypothetical protein
MSSMQLGLLRRWAMAAAILTIALPGRAADLSADSLRLAPGVVKAAAYETIDTKYIVAERVSTAITRFTACRLALS